MLKHISDKKLLDKTQQNFVDKKSHTKVAFYISVNILRRLKKDVAIAHIELKVITIFKHIELNNTNYQHATLKDFNN